MSDDIKGSCASDFVGVRDAFERNFALRNEVGAAVAVWVEGGRAPDGWTARQHPLGAGADACGRCHETAVREGRTAVGPVKSSDVCLECHRAAQFEAKHSHPLEPLRHCGSCHAPHGTSFKGLLRAPAKTLCAACHDS